MSRPEKPESGYEPPVAEDIDTTLGPAEAAAGPVVAGSGQRGIEESNRWHDGGESDEQS